MNTKLLIKLSIILLSLKIVIFSCIIAKYDFEDILFVFTNNINILIRPSLYPDHNLLQEEAEKVILKIEAYLNNGDLNAATIEFSKSIIKIFHYRYSMYYDKLSLMHIDQFRQLINNFLSNAYTEAFSNLSIYITRYLFPYLKYIPDLKFLSTVLDCCILSMCVYIIIIVIIQKNKI